MKCPKCATNNLSEVEEFLVCSNCYYKVKREDVVSHKKGLCVECGRSDLTIAAKGMCWSCYEKAKTGKAPKLGKEYADKPKSTPVPDKSTPVEPTVQECKTESVDFPAATIITKTTKSSNPLLPPAVSCQVVLNFDGKGDLYDWLNDNGVTTDHIIELLELASEGQLKPA